MVEHGGEKTHPFLNPERTETTETKRKGTEPDMYTLKIQHRYPK